MKHILICDDSEEIAEVTQAILELADYRVTVFSCCTQSIIQDVIDILPDLILMDIWMGDIGGEEAIRRLKSHPVTVSIPVLVFTALNDPGKYVRDTGADGMITKPFELVEIVKVLDKVLRSATGASDAGLRTVASS